MIEQAGQGATLGELNRQYFNANIDKINASWIQVLQQQILQYIQAHVNWLDIRKPASDSLPVKMLDYACGSGVASRALSSSVEVIRGIDVSDAMIEKYNDAARSAGISEQQMYAIRGDLLDNNHVEEEAGGLTINSKDFFDFGIVVMSLALHHISDPQAMIKRLVGRLRVGGTLLIIDGTIPEPAQLQAYLDAKHHNHDPEHMMSRTSRVIARLGFDTAEMRTLLLNGGCSESSIEYVVNEDVSKIPEDVAGMKGGLENRIFLARGEGPEPS